MFVPVVDMNQRPLMPTTPSRARRWIKSRKATPFWKKGIFCVRLNIEPFNSTLDPVVVGIDPGSRKEAFTVKSRTHTYLNIQTDTVTWVKKAIKTRQEMRRTRRSRKTPYRKSRWNRKGKSIPPSTRSRWLWKLRIVNWLAKIFPITDFVVEDIKAKAFKGKQKWNESFSPLEVGKKWFCGELSKLGNVHLKRGYETKSERDRLGLTKSLNKLSSTFNSHCVDSWALANSLTKSHTRPDNKDMLLISPLRFHRRQLHYFQPKKNNYRQPYGGTRSLGFKRGSLVKHPKYGLCYVSGVYKERLALRSVTNGSRLCQNAKSKDCKFLTYNIRRTVAQKSIAQ